MAQAAYGANTPPVKDAKACRQLKPYRLMRNGPILNADPQQQVAKIDSVVAVVNDDVITRYELDDRVREVVQPIEKTGYAIARSGCAGKTNSGTHDHRYAASSNMPGKTACAWTIHS